mmetsp:Transcript_15055/g.43737  ORF Transcript_15055/g.43737 Transcript_15055/m.43737 type:complete len:230 (-) Transcript_15055:186-875(-)
MRLLSAPFIIVVASLLGSHAVSALLSVEESEVEVIPNPHTRSYKAEKSLSHEYEPTPPPKQCSSPRCAPKLLLSPHRIIRQVLPTQTDTLIGIERKKVLSVPVPVYQFRQPARLSIAQLPFKLILVADIDVKAGLAEIPTDPIRASDSWFPGYHWVPVLCSSCEEYVHVGWKFSSPSGGDFFYALIVEASERRNGDGIAIGALGDAVAGAIEVGMRAPGWMVSALAKAI